MGLLDQAPKVYKKDEGATSEPNIFLEMQQAAPKVEKPKVDFTVSEKLAYSKKATTTIGAFLLGVKPWNDADYIEEAVKKSGRKAPQEVLEYISRCIDKNELLVISTANKNRLYMSLTRGFITSFISYAIELHLTPDSINAIFQSWTEMHDKLILKATGVPLDIHYTWDRTNLLTKQLKTLDDMFIRMGIHTI